MDRTEKILSIIDKLLTLVENKELDEKLDKWVEYMVSEEDDDEELEEEREEVTENVKDYSPKSLKEENEHLKNLIDLICDTFWFEKYITDSWVLWVAWDKWLLEEIAKARKIINK